MKKMFDKTKQDKEIHFLSIDCVTRIALSGSLSCFKILMLVSTPAILTVHLGAGGVGARGNGYGEET